MNANLQNNLSSLRKHHHSLYAELVPLFDELSVKQINGSPQAIHDEVFHENINQEIDFVYGLGFNPSQSLLEFINNFTKENQGITFIEPDHERFVQSLSIQDFSLIFQNNKVFWAIGNTWKTQLNTIWNTTYCYAAANPFYLTQQQKSHWQEIESYITQETKTRKQNLNAQIQQLPETLKQQSPHPLRIWCFEDLRGKKKYSIIQHALIRTLFHHWKEMGCEVEYLRFVDGEYFPPYYRIIKLAEFKPNVIFLCNKSPAYEYALGAELSRSLPIPKIVWHADDPVYGEHLLERYKVTEDESHWVADYGWQNTLETYGAKNVQYLPGACTKSWKGKKLGRHKCDIVFVGQVRDQSDFFQSLSPGWRNYAEKVIAEKLRFPRKDVNEVLHQFPKPEAVPLDIFDEIKQKILWEANTRFRLQMMKGLLDFDLRIYGNPAWLKWLPPDIAKRCFRGIVHYKRLFDVYRNAKITLNIHSLQTYTCMNVRDFDVPVSGGFLVSDWLPRAEEIFQPGFVSDLPLGNDSEKQVFFYRSIPELQKITHYFLDHEDQRMECIERARQHVLQNHTYKHRAQILYHKMIELSNNS